MKQRLLSLVSALSVTFVLPGAAMAATVCIGNETIHPIAFEYRWSSSDQWSAVVQEPGETTRLVAPALFSSGISVRYSAPVVGPNHNLDADIIELREAVLKPARETAARCNPADGNFNVFRLDRLGRPGIFALR